MVAESSEGFGWSSGLQDRAAGLQQHRQLGWLVKTGLIAFALPLAMG